MNRLSIAVRILNKICELSLEDIAKILIKMAEENPNNSEINWVMDWEIDALASILAVDAGLEKEYENEIKKEREVVGA